MSRLTRAELEALVRDPATYFAAVPERNNLETIVAMAIRTVVWVGGRDFTGDGVFFPSGRVRSLDVVGETWVGTCYFWANGSFGTDYAYGYRHQQNHDHGEVSMSGYISFAGDEVQVHLMTPEDGVPRRACPPQETILAFLQRA